MKSGMLAAEAAFEALGAEVPSLDAYPDKLKASWLWDELHRVRNIRPSFRWGLLPALAYSAFDTYVLRGNAPWTMDHHADNESLAKAASAPRIAYPKPDGKLTFDRLSSVFISNTNHEEDQPVHLKVADMALQKSSEHDVYAGPSARYCPAGVYEWIGEGAGLHYVINAQNCVHCKTCDIKDPSQNITWTCPQGGEGPNYAEM